MTKKFLLYIKSHCEAPDWESEIEAKDRKEAVEVFYSQLKGEFDKEWIDKNIGEEGVEL